ncbi:MAG: homoprotocatechuate degradation operon regulator HpaR [Pseudomonadota bacterium]
MSTHFYHRNLPMLLLRARETVIQYFRPQLKRRALTEQQWRVMRVLDTEGVVDASRLAEESCILPSSLTGVLDRMERDGLIRRSRIESDQRKVLIDLTEHSRAIVGDMQDLIELQYQLIAQRMGQTDLLELYRLLDKVAALAAAPHADNVSGTGADAPAGQV